MTQLVLSLFPGGGLLDHAFALEGFTVVRGPDVLWGGDIRSFSPPAGRFDGIIGGDPCQSHSVLANLVRATGFEPVFPDLTPEFERVVNEARPAWFLRENVPAAPDIKPDGYDVRSFMLCNSKLDSGDGWGNEQMRKRRFWFGVRDGEAPELRKFIKFAVQDSPDRVQAVGSDPRSVPVAIGSNGMVKATKADSTTRTLEEMMELQGMPPDWFKYSPFTMSAKRKICGNGVAIPTGRAIAQAVKRATE